MQKKITKIKERNKIGWSFSCEMFGKIIRKITDFPCPQINMIKIKMIFFVFYEKQISGSEKISIKQKQKTNDRSL